MVATLAAGRFHRCSAVVRGGPKVRGARVAAERLLMREESTRAKVDHELILNDPS